MDLEKYKKLTGVTVPASQEARINASIRRTKAQLEAMLGYTLKPQNLYTELGKVRFEGYLPMLNDLDNLIAPDKEQGVYKLFDYNEVDRYILTDPFTNVYNVKLVMPLNDGEFVTVADLDNVVAKYGRDNVAKTIERHFEWFTWEWYRSWRYSYTSNNDAGLQVAVEADWIDCFPDDIMYLWADMIQFQTSINFGIASESVDGHSWSRTKEDQIPPEAKVDNIKLITRYAGPFGSVRRNPVR